jgi:hypothetical protein
MNQIFETFNDISVDLVFLTFGKWVRGGIVPQRLKIIIL